MGADHAAAGAAESQPADLVQVARGAAGDQPGRSEALMRSTHHFAERGRDGRVIQVLKHSHRRRRNIGEPGDVAIGGMAQTSAPRCRANSPCEQLGQLAWMPILQFANVSQLYTCLAIIYLFNSRADGGRSGSRLAI